MAPAQRGVTIKLFLVEGGPDGLWAVEKSNWTGIGLMCPRSSYPEARSREELARPGVYVLVGPSEQTAGHTRIYVGEADALSKRLDQHVKDKGFWTRAVVFTSKDQNLNKAHVRYLESRLIRLALDAQRAEVENGTAPAPPSLSESEAAEMDSFLDEMLLIYPVLDVRAFDRIEKSAASALRLFAKGPYANAEGEATSEASSSTQARPQGPPRSRRPHRSSPTSAHASSRTRCSRATGPAFGSLGTICSAHPPVRHRPSSHGTRTDAPNGRTHRVARFTRSRPRPSRARCSWSPRSSRKRDLAVASGS